MMEYIEKSWKEIPEDMTFKGENSHWTIGWNGVGFKVYDFAVIYIPENYPTEPEIRYKLPAWIAEIISDHRRWSTEDVQKAIKHDLGIDR